MYAMGYLWYHVTWLATFVPRIEWKKCAPGDKANHVLQIQVTPYSTTHMGVAEKVAVTFTYAVAAIKEAEFFLIKSKVE